MVMVTRSCARKRACEIFDDTGSDNTCNVPPWCSSGKSCERRKPRKIPESICEIRSTYISPPNVWKNSCKDKSVQSCCSRKKKSKSCRVQHRDNIGNCGRVVFLSFFVLASFGAVVYFWSFQSMKDREDIKALLGLDKTSLAIDEECCYKMKQLAAALLQAEQTLRRTRRQHTLMLTAQTTKLDTNEILENDFIVGATAVKGLRTEEWGGRAALWGIVPLWRASPPPQTILSTRNPMPADCWPFSGSRGEVTIELPRRMRVRRVSVEHVRPDAARSAPRHFAIYGVLENGTSTKCLNGEYRYEGPAKQYFAILHEVPPIKRVVYRVLTNHGNMKYTCLYRIHVYGSSHNK